MTRLPCYKAYLTSIFRDWHERVFSMPLPAIEHCAIDLHSSSVLQDGSLVVQIAALDAIDTMTRTLDSMALVHVFPINDLFVGNLF